MRPPPMKRPLGVLKNISVNRGQNYEQVVQVHARHSGSPKYHSREDLMARAKELRGQ